MDNARDPQRRRLPRAPRAGEPANDGDGAVSVGAAPSNDGVASRSAVADEPNHLLALLGPAQHEALLERADVVSYAVHDVLFRERGPLTHVYFPHSGEFSVVRKLENGAQVEVATVGREGMIWLDAFFGGQATPLRCFTQLPGTMLRLTIADFAELAAEGTELNAVMRCYAQALLHQMAQTVACNRLHSIEQRCARWLLMTHDRAQGDTFPLTQEFLAAMLGVRRAGVTVAEGKLRRAGLIRYTRGHVTVTDRGGLEAAACECYRTDAAEYARLLGEDSSLGPRGSSPAAALGR